MQIDLTFLKDCGIIIIWKVEKLEVFFITGDKSMSYNGDSKDFTIRVRKEEDESYININIDTSDSLKLYPLDETEVFDKLLVSLTSVINKIKTEE